MLKIKASSHFKKDLKRFKHNHSGARQELDKVFELLAREEPLPEKYQDHRLSGKWNLARECHVKPDVLLIYSIDQIMKQLNLVRLGSHSDLFV
ncbi:MAG: mRNA interferase YafQ [Chlamydiae bacterium]|nr:mRNA interferase YafQ [Chlamydiota bacterium]